MPWSPHESKHSMDDHHQLLTHKLSEHQAVLSVLFALRGSCPRLPPALTGLPALGSKPLRDTQEQANALLRRSAAAASTSHCRAPGPAQAAGQFCAIKHSTCLLMTAWSCEWEQLHQRQQAAADRSWVSAFCCCFAAAGQHASKCSNSSSSSSSWGCQDSWCPDRSQVTNETAAAADFVASAPVSLVDACGEAAMHLASAPVKPGFSSTCQEASTRFPQHMLLWGAATSCWQSVLSARQVRTATEAVTAAERVQPSAVLPFTDAGPGIRARHPFADARDRCNNLLR